MVVERRDGLVPSLVKTKDPIRVLRGERTWTHVTEPGKLIDSWWESPETLNLNTRVEVRLASQDSVEEQRIAISGITPFPMIPQTHKGNEINEPHHRWAGRIKWHSYKDDCPYF